MNYPGEPTSTPPAGLNPLRAVDSVQTVLTALILAFVFRAFLVEAFVIPTGSMAQALLGEHGTIVCPNCGWEFDFGPAPHAEADGLFVPPSYVDCPNCHVPTDLPDGTVPRRPGDRILVHKWPYLFGGPFRVRRWDVIVFRDPVDPAQNYIKRVVGLPGEAIEIIDGDVFVQSPADSTAHIARKPNAAQRALWFPVYHQGFVPRRRVGLDRPPAWVAQPAGTSDRSWSGLAGCVLRCDARDDQAHALRFDPLGSRDYLRDIYGYNHHLGGSPVGDVRLCAELTFDRPAGWLDWRIDRDGVSFRVRFAADGTVKLFMNAAGAAGDGVLIGQAADVTLSRGRAAPVEFGHLDYRVYVRVGGREVLATTDDQYAPDLERLRDTVRVVPPQIHLIAARTALTLRDLRIERDVHYTRTQRTTRALPGRPFRLNGGEFFVLGDNSPRSHDSREWTRAGLHLSAASRAAPYRIGTVPADQIVGRAFFVYLPSLLPVDDSGRWRIPDIGRVRFVR